MRLDALFTALLAAAPPTAASGAATAGSSPPSAGACPSDMVLVRGVHHEHIQRVCTDYVAAHCFAFIPGLVMREPRATPVHTCIDRYEWPNQPGANPAVMMRFVDAAAMCEAAGKRLCTEFEWELACEGPRLFPFPYGFAKQPGACRVDQPYRAYDAAKLESPSPQLRELETARLYQGVPSGSLPVCQSPFGAFDMVGNVEEWVTTSRPEWPYRSSLKGGYWAKPWAGCRGTNERHGPRFRFYQIGFRCCRDPLPR
jgi:hypothetical protein